MPKKLLPMIHPRSMYTLPTEGSQQFLSEPLQLLTESVKPLPISPQVEEDIVSCTPITSPPLMPTLPESGNDPQLLAELFKPTVEAMLALNMLALVKTESGKLVLILPTDLFNDDLTYKMLA